ncbi:hypothetical protein [Candidatus Neptunichlamydia sp. REUL1]|uniref:hypothetical protein n=1 Tax=Candidatus Neptunichlamydia sp. REUL1 TaxID=3064277 RepID=UPI00292E5EA7|nr:hypothetical protein [Candidatus Neptunochlamydia sp. REUL1]
MINNWFQPKHFSYLLGLFIAIGSPAVLIFKAGFNQLEKILQWHGAIMTFGLARLIFACIFFFVVQDAPGSRFFLHSTITDKKEFWKNIRQVFNSSHVWVIGIAVGLIIGPLLAFESI